MIADEVQTALGRTGEYMWGFMHHEVGQGVDRDCPLADWEALGMDLIAIDMEND